jgi:RimJ/RimL family protein N-acetyltransferase
MEEFPQLATERLLLRPFNASDGLSVERLAGRREVADTTLAIPHPYPAGGGAQWIGTHAAAWARRENLALAICNQTSPDELLGAISLQLSLPHSHGELGYWIGVDHWGKGFATEAAQALATYSPRCVLSVGALRGCRCLRGLRSRLESGSSSFLPIHATTAGGFRGRTQSLFDPRS